MYFRILHDDASGELSYLLADLDTREAVLVDPRGRDLPLLLALLARLGAPLVQGQGGGPGIERAGEGNIYPFGHELVRVLATPGHTAGCLSFAWRDRLFCGGLLAIDSCPHQPKPAAPQALWDSVRQRVFTLPDETLLFAAQERQARAVSTVLAQRRWHPLFAGLSRDAFLARVAALPTQPSTA